MLLTNQVLNNVVFMDCYNVTDVPSVEWHCLHGL